MSTLIEGTPGPSGPKGEKGPSRRRPSAHMMVAAAVIVAALLAAVVVVRTVGSEGSPPPEPVAATAPAPAPPPAAPEAAPTPSPAAPDPEPPLPPGARSAADVIAEEYGITDLASSGLRVEDDGLELITGIFEAGYDFLADEGDWRVWTRHFRVRPSRVPGFAESTAVLLDPLRPCVDFHRQVIGVSTGIGGQAGARIEAALLEATGPRPFPYTDSEVRGALGGCLDPAKGEWWGKGYVLDEVLSVPCALPDRELRCYVVTRWFYAQGARNHWYAESFVFDAATGARLTATDLHPGMSVDRLDRLARLVLHDDVDLPLFRGEPDEVPMELDSGVAVIPTMAGAKVLWLDYYRFQSHLDVIGRWVNVPWAIVREG